MRSTKTRWSTDSWRCWLREARGQISEIRSRKNNVNDPHSGVLSYGIVLGGMGGALLPLAGSVRCRPRVALGHIAMAIAMAGMLVPGDVYVWGCWVGGVALVGMSVWLTGECAEPTHDLRCALDLVAMGLLMLFALPSHTTPNGLPTHQVAPSPRVHQHTAEFVSGASSWLGPSMIALWGAIVVALVVAPRRGKTRHGNAIAFTSTAVMIAAMVPMAA